MEFTYKIGGKPYIQRPLVLGQIRQLLGVLEGVAIPADVGALGLIYALGAHLSGALAVVLTPEGEAPRDKDLDFLSTEIEFAIQPEQALEVIDDFFTCNPISSLLERMAGVVEKMTGSLVATGSERSSSSSATGISSDATPSSGAMC